MNIIRRLTSAACIAAVIAVFAGCASRGESPLPAVALPAQWAERSAADGADQASLPDWRHTFNDPVLNRLIDEGLQTNADLAAAAIRVRRAQLQVGLAGTNRMPDASLAMAGSGARALSGGRSVRASGASAGFSYEVDLWGKLAAQRDAANWEWLATAQDSRSTRLSLIGTIAALYWQLGYLNRQIALNDASIASAEQRLRLVAARFQAGAVGEFDVTQAQLGVLAQRAAQTQWIQQRTECRHALAVLFDQPPERRMPEPAELPRASLVQVPAGLPASLLHRRPDLAAAAFRLRESLANIDIARTSFYPAFSLTGSLGSASDTLIHVLQNPVATLGAGLALPFIQWNTMSLTIKVSQSEYEEAVVGFRGAVYNALAEVEDALAARTQLDDEARQLDLALIGARRAEALARTRARGGLTGEEPWLDAAQTLRDAESARELNRLAQLNNRMMLFRALGGDLPDPVNPSLDLGGDQEGGAARLRFLYIS